MPLQSIFAYPQRVRATLICIKHTTDRIASGPSQDEQIWPDRRAYWKGLPLLD